MFLRALCFAVVISFAVDALAFHGQYRSMLAHEARSFAHEMGRLDWSMSWGKVG